MKDTHATVVTKYTLFLQLYVLLLRLSCFTFRITCDFDYKISLDGQTQLLFDNPQGCHLLWQPSACKTFCGRQVKFIQVSALTVSSISVFSSPLESGL